MSHTITLNENQYNIDFNNYALHQFGEAAGFETYQDLISFFAGLLDVVNSEGKQLTLKQYKTLGTLCYIALKEGTPDLDLTEKQVFNLLPDNPELLLQVIPLATDSLPKPHKEDRSENKKKAS